MSGPVQPPQFPPDPKWPGAANIAVQFVINYEEGAENCVLHEGDTHSEVRTSMYSMRSKKMYHPTKKRVG